MFYEIVCGLDRKYHQRKGEKKDQSIGHASRAVFAFDGTTSCFDHKCTSHIFWLN